MKSTDTKLTGPIIITIDGPAGAGKSTIAKKLAERLNLYYLDTGAMYRTAALLGIQERIDWSDESGFAQLVSQHKIESREGRAFLDGEEVSEAIRTPETTQCTKYAADNIAIRKQMIALQRQEGSQHGLVTEGRDQGSVVFPDALCKFYLTATPEARAQRRMSEWSKKGPEGDFEEILHDINERDRRDRAREVGPLCQPPDAIVIDSSTLAIDQVLDEMESIVHKMISSPHDFSGGK